jgi:hypothetical protein
MGLLAVGGPMSCPDEPAGESLEDPSEQLCGGLTLQCPPNKSYAAPVPPQKIRELPIVYLVWAFDRWVVTEKHIQPAKAEELGLGNNQTLKVGTIHT